MEKIGFIGLGNMGAPLAERLLKKYQLFVHDLDENNIKYLVVHCSDTDDKVNLKALDIHKMHLSFGWNGIGYHKIICKITF